MTNFLKNSFEKNRILNLPKSTNSKTNQSEIGGKSKTIFVHYFVNLFVDYQYDDEDYENMPAPSIPESTSARIVLKSTTKNVVITTTPSTTTSMTTGGGGGASATTRASTLMTGSTSMDLDLITTQIPKLDIEVTTLRPAAARPASTTASTVSSKFYIFVKIASIAYQHQFDCFY